MKRLFYLSGSCFFLALTLLIGIQIGAKKAEAQASLVYAAGSFSLDFAYVAASDGYMWELRNGTGWSQSRSLPVPPTQVAFLLTSHIVIDTSGNGWAYDSGAWVNWGPPPLSPVAAEQTTWGGIKKRFADKPEDK